MIVTFYSFKGGVGRSMALANIANWLRLQNLRVAVIDWDLEAPGIECFFLEDERARETVRAAPGLLDLVVSYQARHAQLPLEFFLSDPEEPPRESGAPRENDARRENEGGGKKRRFPGRAPKAPRQRDETELARAAEILSRELPPLSSLFVQVAPENQADAARGGPIWLLSPGIRDGDKKYAYARDVQSLDWNAFYADYDGEVFFAWLRGQLESTYDITLIDSRTGMTEVGGVCTREMADVVVALCAANTQNLSGTELFARSLFTSELRRARRGRPLHLTIIPARYDNGETDFLRSFQQRFVEMTRRLRELDPDAPLTGLDPAATWENRIPYTPKYAYTERLCVGAPDANPDLEQQYVKAAKFLATEYVARLAPEARAQAVGSSSELKLLAKKLGAADVSLDATLETAFRQLPEATRALAEPLLLRFVGYADRADNQSVALQRRLKSEFSSEQTAHVDALLQARLISIELDTTAPTKGGADGKPLPREFLRIPYPSALKEWNRLHELVAANREFLYWRYQLQTCLFEYERSGHDPRALAPTAILTEGERYAKRLALELSAAERTFFEQSASAENRPARGPAAKPPDPAVSEPMASPLGRDEGLPLGVGIVETWGASVPSNRSRRVVAVAMGATALIVSVPLVLVLLSRSPISPNPMPMPVSSVTPPANSTTDPSSGGAAAAISRARTLEAVGDDENAKSEYSTAIQLDKRAKDAYIGRGNIFVREKKFDNALDDFTKAVDLDPRDASAHLLRGKTAFRLAKIDDAIRDYEKAISLSDANAAGSAIADAYYELAQARASQGDRTASIDAYTKAIQYREKFWDAYYDRAMAELDAENKPAAITDLKFVSNQATDTALKTNALAKLKELGVTAPVVAPRPSTPRVYVMYANAADSDLVKSLVVDLRAAQEGVRDIELQPARTLGDVRYYYKNDAELAAAVKKKVEALLAKREVPLALKLLPLDAASFPKAQSGTVEVWLPSLRKAAVTQDGPSKKESRNIPTPVGP